MSVRKFNIDPRRPGTQMDDLYECRTNNLLGKRRWARYMQRRRDHGNGIHGRHRNWHPALEFGWRWIAQGNREGRADAEYMADIYEERQERLI